MSKLFCSGFVFQTPPILARKLATCSIRRYRPLPSTLNRPKYFSTNGQNAAKQQSRIRWFWMPAGVGFALISFVQLRHIRDREKRKYAPPGQEPLEQGIPQWQVNLFKVVPTRALSRVWGAVHDIQLPVSLRGPVVRSWTWMFDCCLDEAEHEDVSTYQNLGEFFTRKLKEGVRAIDESCELVCPVDGRVLHFGRVVDRKLEQVKGVPYSLGDFLGPQSSLDKSPAKNSKNLYQCVLYLGPGDCHHFHSPTEWHVESRRHFPGELYSVSPWVLKGFKDVLCTNERVSLYGDWKHGAFIMTAVGAYNVGSINICFDEELKTNERKAKMDNFQERKFNGRMTLIRGDHIGWFAMGSAVVLIFEGPKDFEFVIKPRQKVKLGQALGFVKELES